MNLKSKETKNYHNSFKNGKLDIKPWKKANQNNLKIFEI